MDRGGVQGTWAAAASIDSVLRRAMTATTTVTRRTRSSMPTVVSDIATSDMAVVETAAPRGSELKPSAMRMAHAGGEGERAGGRRR